MFTHIHDECIPDEYIFRSRSLPLALFLSLFLSSLSSSFFRSLSFALALLLSLSFSCSISLDLATVVENDVQVKKNISLAVHTSLETFVRWFKKQLTKKYVTGIFCVLQRPHFSIILFLRSPCDYTFKAGPKMKCPSSCPLNFDEFPFS